MGSAALGAVTEPASRLPSPTLWTIPLLSPFNLATGNPPMQPISRQKRRDFRSPFSGIGHSQAYNTRSCGPLRLSLRTLTAVIQDTSSPRNLSHAVGQSGLFPTLHPATIPISIWLLLQSKHHPAEIPLARPRCQNRPLGNVCFERHFRYGVYF